MLSLETSLTSIFLTGKEVTSKKGARIGGVEEKLNHNERVRNEVNQKAKD